MIVGALTATGTVLALGVLLLMAVSSVLPDIWDSVASDRRTH